MSSTIQINQRGTMTLPMRLRKRLGLEKGGVVMAEESEEGIVLKPAVAFPVEMYTDSRVKEFEKESDRLHSHLRKKRAE